MKKSVLILPLLSSVAFADANYPISTPTYIPTAVSPLTAMATGAAYYGIRTNGLGVASIRLLGTCTGLTSTVEVTNEVTPTATWTGVKAYPADGSAPSATLTAAGLFSVNVAGMAQLRLNVSALSTANCSYAMAGTPTMAYPTIADPCSSPFVAKTTVAINAPSSATAYKLVSLSTGLKTYICGFTVTSGGTSPTFVFSSGTKVSAECDTSAVSLTGLFTPSATIATVYSYVPITAAASKDVCITNGSTTATQGVLSYVQM